MSNPSLLVVGAGPGVSGSVARRFGRGGVRRRADRPADADQLEPLAAELAGRRRHDRCGPTADVTDAEALTAAVARLRAGTAGHIDVAALQPERVPRSGPR